MKKNAAYEYKRRYVLHRDYQRCVWCRGRERLTVHHVKPGYIGGVTQVPNLLTLCHTCHDRMEQRVTRIVILARSYVIWLVFGPVLRLARYRNDVWDVLQAKRSHERQAAIVQELVEQSR